ncbi:MAG TPA: sigma factor-like helix-turn-helix DNA-binding protein [Microbacterium sp.]|nr:sigma factor-like helix-turn-helix DNA-binding protein [Microbacterium sp.]
MCPERSAPGGKARRRFAIVEHSVLQRRRVEQLLTEHLKVQLVNVSSTVRELLSWLRGADRACWPHLLVLNFPMLASDSDAEELEIVRMLRDAGMRVLVLSTLHRRAVATRLREIGVEGIVSAADTEADFVAAASTVLAGQKVITPLAVAATVDASGPDLSVQERRVLSLYASGLTISDVAERIGVREDTARKYLARVKAKYAAIGRPARSKLELARAAWDDGLLGLDPVIKELSARSVSRPPAALA